MTLNLSIWSNCAHFVLLCFAVSRVFDDSEDEFEDDYTESIKLINDFEKRLEQKAKTEEAAQKVSEIRMEQDKDDIKSPIKSQNVVVEPFHANSAMRTRSSNRLKNISESKAEQASTSYDTNRTIEVLMDELDDENTEFEYVIADAADAASDEPFQSIDSNDDLNALMVEDDAFDAGPFVLQNVTKDNELDMSDDSMEKSVDDEEDDDTGNYSSCKIAYHLESMTVLTALFFFDVISFALS